MKQSPFDPCLFSYTRDGAHQPEGLLGIHVDDGLCCGTPLFFEKIAELEKSYPFGSRKRGEFTFTGLHIKQHDDYRTTINQTQYTRDIHAIPINKERRQQPDHPANEIERQQLRAVIGSLQYAAITPDQT